MNTVFVVIDHTATPVCAFMTEESAKQVVEDLPEEFLTYIEIPLCMGIVFGINIA